MRQAFSEQVPPGDLEAEQSVLGACLVSPVGRLSAVQALDPSDFYSDKHALIFRVIKELDERGPVDPIMVHSRLSDLGKAETTGGLTYLFSCINTCPTPNVPEGYIEVVKSKATRRRLLAACLAGITAAKDEITPLDEVQAKIEGLVLGARDPAKDESDPEEWAAEVETEAALTEAGEAGRRRIMAGYEALDDHLLLWPGRSTVVAGGTSQGKSALVGAIAANSALRLKQRTYVWTGEMDRREWWERMAASELEIPYTNVQRRELTGAQAQAIRNLARKIKQAPLIVRDAPMSMAEIRADCRYIARTQGQIDLIIIDYLGLLSDLNRETEGSDRRDVRIGIVVWSAIQLAKELGAHVILVAQLNREQSRRQTARPRLSDLKDSSTIEQHAHAVVFVYRGDRDEALTDEEREEYQGTLEAIIAKQRGGVVGSRFLGFAGEYQKLTNLHRSRWPGQKVKPAGQPKRRGGKDRDS